MLQKTRVTFWGFTLALITTAGPRRVSSSKQDKNRLYSACLSFWNIKLLNHNLYKVNADDPIPNETTTEDWVDINTNARMGSQSNQAVKAKSTDQTKAEGASSENVMEQIEDVIAQLLAGEKTELLVGLIVGGLVLVVLIIGLVYNCVQRSGPPKHLDLDFAMYEADSDEDGEGSDRGSKVLSRPKKARTIERRSGVVSFLASIGKKTSNTDSITSQTV